jgi:hypothetical protein
VFVTSEGHPGARLQRALAAGNIVAAEQAAFDVPFVPLTEARALVELYAEKGDRKFERAALKYLRRYRVRTSEPTRKAVVTASSARSAAPTVNATLWNRLFIRPHGRLRLAEHESSGAFRMVSMHVSAPA